MERPRRLPALAAAALLSLAGAARANDPPHEPLPASFDAVFGPVAQDPEEPDWRLDRADAFAPVGVLGDHLHPAGGWMLGLRYTRRSLAGNRDGRDQLGTQDVFDDGYLAAPTEMSSSELLLAAMYAPTDRLTLMATLPYLWKSMDHARNPALTPGGGYTTETDGLGDAQIGLLYGVVSSAQHRAHLNLGLSVPTGSVTESDDQPGAPDSRLPYPMQLGSGSFAMIPGATYTGRSAGWSWGVQALYTVQLEESSEDYTAGNELDITGWGARRWSDAFSTSVRLAWAEWKDVDGRDDELPTLPDAPGFPVPNADPTLQAGQRLDVGLGLWALGTGGLLKGNRLGLEFLLPVHQDLDGPQLETDWALVAGWQLAF